jgi:hydroxypyruvate isomerase
MLYGEHGFLDRFAAARADGFEAVEFQFPYAFAAADIAARLKDNGLKLVLHNLPAGNWEGGDRGVAIFPDRVQEFRDGVAKAIDYAGALGCTQLNCLAGALPKGPSLDIAHHEETLVENLAFAAGKLKAAGIRLLVEAVNDRDVAGFYVTSTRQTADLIARVGSDNIFIQYDVYHMQRMEGDLVPTMEKHWDRIGHIQIADNPGRNEPGTGEINYPFLFDWLDAKGYAGWIGAEYKPKGATSAGLGWLKR